MVKGLDDGDESEALPVTNGVNQGCVVSPTLFSMVFSAMRTRAFEDPSLIVRIEYLRHLKTVTKAKETVIRAFLFAEDCTLSANTEQMMQNELDCSSQGCGNFGLTISTTKTEVMYQLAPGKLYCTRNHTQNL